LFPIREWRRAIDAVADRIGADVIGPFGFELTGSPRFLSSRLRYLFLYVDRVPELPAGEALIHEVCAALNVSLPEVAATVEIVDYDRHVVPTAAVAGSRTLIIRSVHTQQPLLTTWARYIVAASLRRNRSRISAVLDFSADLMAQRYCCQLATMHDALFASLPNAPSLSGGKQIFDHLRRLQSVGLAERFKPELGDPAMATRIRAAIDGYYDELNDVLEASGLDGECDSVPDFHGGRVLEYPVCDVASRAADLAVRRYQTYPHHHST
jgi:hypothetical protein